MFGILMQDNTPLDPRFRRSGRGAEEQVRLGFTPGGPYYGNVPGTPYGYTPGGPYYPRGSPRRFAGQRFGIPPGQAARVPQYGGFGSFRGDDADGPTNVPGVPETFGEHMEVPGVPFGRFAGRGFAGTCHDMVTDTNYYCDTTLQDAGIGPSAPLNVDPATGTSTQNWTGYVQGTLDILTGIIKAATSGQQAQTYSQGSCPQGSVFVPSLRRCVPVQGASDNTGLIVAGVLGLGVVAFILSRKG